MSTPIEEVISQYLDALHTGARPAAATFLAQYPDLPPRAAAGLLPILETLRQTAPAAGTVPGSPEASWQRLDALIAAQPGASSAPATPTIAAAAPAPSVPASPRGGTGHIHVGPASGRPFAWQLPLAAGAILIALVALVLLRPLGGGPVTGPPLPGTATPSQSAADGTTPPPAASDGQVPSAVGGPIATVTAGPYTGAVDVLAADGHLIILGVRIAADESSRRPGTSAPLPAAGITLQTVDGTTLQALQSCSGCSWHPPGHPDETVRGADYAFDAGPLTTTAPTLTLHLTMQFSLGPDINPGGPFRPNVTPVPTTGPPPVTAIAPFDGIVQVPFDPRRRIAEPNLTVTGRGVTLTLARVEVTASETRLYLRGALPGGVTPQLHGNIWTLQADGANASGSYIGTRRDPATGETVVLFGANLLDKPSPWVLDLPAVTVDGTGGIATPGGPHTWAGPWTFYFAMPAASASLTPGPLPTLPPATAIPTPLPGAVPTYVGPQSGPVPPTPTVVETPALPAATPDCAHPQPLFLDLGDLGYQALPTRGPVPGSTPAPPVAPEDVAAYLQSHLTLGGRVTITADPNPTVVRLTQTTWLAARARYPLGTTELGDRATVYLAELQGQFVMRGPALYLDPTANPGVPSPCGWPAGVLGVYPAEVAVFSPVTGNLLTVGGVPALVATPGPVPTQPAMTPVPTLVPPTPGAADASTLAAIRAEVSFPVFVPATPPPGLTPEPPTGGDTSQSLVQITYHRADGAVGLLVMDGPAGCCLAADNMHGGTPVSLANGLAAHALPGTPESGGPILWWEQDGSFIALSGPEQTQVALTQIAATLSRTADLGPIGPVLPRPTPPPVATPAFAILRPAWLPDGLVLREEYPQQPGPDGPVTTVMQHYDAAVGSNPTDALLLIEQPTALAPASDTPEPGSTPETIGGRAVAVGMRGSACTTLSWIEGGVYLQLVNSYDDSGTIRYSCADMQHIVQSVP